MSRKGKSYSVSVFLYNKAPIKKRLYVFVVHEWKVLLCTAVSSKIELYECLLEQMIQWNLKLFTFEFSIDSFRIHKKFQQNPKAQPVSIDYIEYIMSENANE